MNSELHYVILWRIFKILLRCSSGKMPLDGVDVCWLNFKIFPSKPLLLEKVFYLLWVIKDPIQIHLWNFTTKSSYWTWSWNISKINIRQNHSDSKLTESLFEFTGFHDWYTLEIKLNSYLKSRTFMFLPTSRRFRLYTDPTVTVDWDNTCHPKVMYNF